MNPQYMQQQHPLYGPPQANAQYGGELNANLSQKGSQDTQSFPPQTQKPPLGPLPASTVPPTSRSPYYMNDIQRQPSDTQHGPPLQQSNQNSLVDQISNMTLSGHQRPPSAQGLPPQPDKNIQTIPFSSAVNGISNQNQYPSQGNILIKYELLIQDFYVS